MQAEKEPSIEENLKKKQEDENLKQEMAKRECNIIGVLAKIKSNVSKVSIFHFHKIVKKS